MTLPRSLASLLAAVALILCRTAALHAAGFIVILPTEPVPPRPAPPGMTILPPHPRPTPWPVVNAPLEIANPRVDVRIEGQTVTTTVEQEFVNPNDRALEADFFFPLPRGAHIDKASMEINGRQTEGELLSADKARGIYEDIVRRMKDPALLEYAGRDVFRARIFPIEPRSRKPIRLTYTELLRADDGTLTYRCSLGNAATAAGARVHVALRADAPLTAIYSPSHPVEIRRDAADPKRATVSWEAKGTTAAAAGDFQLVFAPEKSDLALRVLTFRDPAAGRDEDGYFLLLAAPRPDAKAERPAPKDVTFVVDTSGSMAGAKINQARKALDYCVNSLNPEDRFEIVRFSTEAEGLFGGLREANEENRKRALAFVRDLRAAGGTAIAEALKTGLRSRPTAGGGEGRPFVMAFLTDGQPTVGPTNEEEILASLKGAGGKDVRVFAFGIGSDVNTHLLDRLAEGTRAFSQYVLPEEDIEVKVSAFFARLREPALTGLKLEFGDAVKVRQLDPAELPDLFRGDQLLALGRYAGGGEVVPVKLTGRAAGREQTFEARLRFDETASGSEAAAGREFIPRLWATRRVGFLLDEIRLRGENAELRDEVVTLARKFGVVTPYTAYLILDDEERRRVPDARRSLSGLNTDAAAKDMARGAFESFKKEKSGDAAVANAQSQGVLRRAEQAAGAQSENRAFAMSAAKAAPAAAAPATGSRARGGGLGGAVMAGAPPPPPVDLAAADRLDAATQNAARFVGGRAFYQNGSQWVDAAAQNRRAGQSAPQRVQFGSSDYFTLLKDHPEAGPFLALGPNVLLALGDSVYEVYE